MNSDLKWILQICGEVCLTDTFFSLCVCVHEVVSACVAVWVGAGRFTNLTFFHIWIQMYNIHLYTNYKYTHVFLNYLQVTLLTVI
jgi:hypothetical protein